MMKTPTVTVYANGTTSNVTSCVSGGADVIRCIIDTTVTAVGNGYVDNRGFQFDAQMP